MNSQPKVDPENHHAFGNAPDVKADLARRSITGGVSLVVSEICCNAFRLLGTVIMARLLTPEHFGLISMVTALTAFAEMFKDLGLGMATVQQKEITHEQISTLFWINVGVGGVITLLLIGASPVIARFYNDPRLVWITIAISSTFLFGGLTVQHQALLRRHMHFSQLAVIQVFSTGLSTIIGIVLAWKGFEYWALVWKEVSRAIIQAGGTWVLSRWSPGLPVRGAGVRRMFQMGSHVTGFNVLAFASRNLDQVLLGKFWGAGPVGLYKQAAQLLLLPGSLFSYPVTYVMTPALSSLQSDPERYRSYYKNGVSFLAFGYMPLIAYLAVYSDSLITLVLSDKWIASSMVLKILAFGAIIEPIAGTCGIVMITCGRTKEYLRIGAVQAIALSVAVLIGTHWGLIGVAAAVAACTILGLPFLAWFSFKETPISPGLFYEALRFPALASGIMSALLVAIQYLLNISNGILEIGYSVLLAPLLYCSIWVLLPGGRWRLAESLSQFQRAFAEVTSRVRASSTPSTSGL